MSCGIACLWLVLFGATKTLQAQGAGWSTPVSLGPYWFPDVAVDGSGRVHVVWSYGGDGFDTVMYAANVEGAWSRPLDIAAMPQVAGGSEASRPTLLITPDNIVHLTYRDTTIYYTQAPAGGAGIPLYWREPNPIAEGYFSRLAYDSEGVLHMVYTQNVPTELCRVCYHLFYVRSIDDGFTWSDPVDISVQLTGSAKPSLLVDRNDHLHVVWESGYGGSYGQLSDPTTVLYTVSRDGGASWSPPYALDPARGQGTNLMARNITIAEDANGNLLVAWWGIPEDLVYYQLSRDGGQSWSLPTPIPGAYGIWSVYQSRLDNYASAVDSAGRVHLVVVGRRQPEQTQAELLRYVWDGSNWLGADRIVGYERDMPEWPRIAVGLGNQLHVVWFVRDAENLFNSDAGNYQVWHSMRTVDSPALSPIPVPTLPVPTPIVRTELSVSHLPPTPTSPIRPITVENPAPPTSGIVSSNIRSEHDEMMVLLFSLAPVVLVIVFLALAFQVRRSLRSD
ncbi:MAG: hypothetical protein NZ553_12295 [Caldilinea sp.]|nr:hypothetical protein [Caldilinea sp.]MDW8441248.1 hypothetical protein [Caldilineaceae bacterium]